MLTAAGFKVSLIAVQKWGDRSSIPGPYWQVLSDLDLASLEELAKAVAKPSGAGAGTDLNITSDPLAGANNTVHPAQPAGLVIMGNRP